MARAPKDAGEAIAGVDLEAPTSSGVRVLILLSFHRFVPNPAGGRALKESFPAGKTLDASDEDAATWIAAGLAKAAD